MEIKNDGLISTSENPDLGQFRGLSARPLRASPQTCSWPGSDFQTCQIGISSLRGGAEGSGKAKSGFDHLKTMVLGPILYFHLRNTHNTLHHWTTYTYLFLNPNKSTQKTILRIFNTTEHSKIQPPKMIMISYMNDFLIIFSTKESHNRYYLYRRFLSLPPSFFKLIFFLWTVNSTFR